MLDGFNAIQKTESVTIQTPTLVTNPYGDSHYDWSSPTERTIDAVVWPRTSEENNENRHAVISGLSMAIDAKETVTAHERVVVRGDSWEVDGDVADWLAPWGWHPGKQVNLRKVKG